jgi:hypothetical protein
LYKFIDAQIKIGTVSRKQRNYRLYSLLSISHLLLINYKFINLLIAKAKSNDGVEITGESMNIQMIISL